MSRKLFTDKEMEMLRNNQYTYTVTPSALYFTKEFKELFWKEYQKGKSPRLILDKYGYPADVLGTKRIWGIAHNIKIQYDSEEGFQEGSVKREIPDSGSHEITAETVRQLQEEVRLLRQEMERMKNASLNGTGGE